MITSQLSVIYNRLLRALPDDEIANLRSFLEPVNLRSGEFLNQPGEPLEYVYFPENCLISLMRIFENGDTVESGCIGREGIVGAALSLSTSVSNCAAQVQIGGKALRIRVEQFLLLLAPETAFRRLVKEYMAVFIEQISQVGACNSQHLVGARLARLLLICQDRTGSFHLKLTHDSISQMMGGCRPPISLAAHQLRDKGLIGYSRGIISIIDRQKLEEEACECFHLIHQSYQNYGLFLKQPAILSLTNTI